MHFFRSLWVLLLLVAGHVVQVVWFAAGYFVAVHFFQLGHLSSAFSGAFSDYFYHSAVTYSTLGLSEIPSGHLRFITAIESLTRIIILTWSATFFYSVMGRGRKIIIDHE